MASKREQELEQAIQGMAGYIQDTLNREDASPAVTFRTIIHDIMGLAQRTENFLPRTRPWIHTFRP